VVTLFSVGGFDLLPSTRPSTIRNPETLKVMTSQSTVSVIVPVFNEERTIADVVRRLRALPLRVEIIAVNDASTDATRNILASLAATRQVDKVIHQTTNQGKGAAIRRGIAECSGDVIVVQDADLEYDPEDLPRMLAVIDSGRADAVFGSRFLGGSERRVLYFWHSIGNRLLTLLSNMLTDLNLSDMETGYKMVRSPLMKQLVLRSNRFGFEPEITARLAQTRARLYEVTVSYSGRTYAEGKKISWRDGVAAIWHIVRFNLFDRGAR
jgi:glycosyltransferase involved in cell wall biosynthesis